MNDKNGTTALLCSVPHSTDIILLYYKRRDARSCKDTETQQWVMGCCRKPVISACFYLNRTDLGGQSKRWTHGDVHSIIWMQRPWLCIFIYIYFFINNRWNPALVHMRWFIEVCSFANWYVSSHIKWTHFLHVISPWLLTSTQALTKRCMQK